MTTLSDCVAQKVPKTPLDNVIVDDFSTEQLQLFFIMRHAWLNDRGLYFKGIQILLNRVDETCTAELQQQRDELQAELNAHLALREVKP